MSPHRSYFVFHIIGVGYDMSFSLEGVSSYAKDAWTVQVRIAHLFIMS